MDDSADLKSITCKVFEAEAMILSLFPSMIRDPEQPAICVDAIFDPASEYKYTPFWSDTTQCSFEVQESALT